MKKIHPSKAFIICLVIVFMIFGLMYAKTQKLFIFKLSSYSQAKASCGGDPVIGVGDEKRYFLLPSGTDHELTSQYNPTTASNEKYGDAEFFCTAEEAESHGYGRHECCGFSTVD